MQCGFFFIHLIAKGHNQGCALTCSSKLVEGNSTNISCRVVNSGIHFAYQGGLTYVSRQEPGWRTLGYSVTSGVERSFYCKVTPPLVVGG